jgi:Kef-type K+ transport system membrane component KefB
MSIIKTDFTIHGPCRFDRTPLAMTRSAQLYLVLISIAALSIFGMLRAGSQLAPSGSVASLQPTHLAAAGSSSFVGAARDTLYQNGTSPLSRLFLQLLLIIGAACATGALFKRIGQPAVVGEMVAGILLGPSLFGLLAPHAFGFVFPPASLEPLRLFSQLGVCLFMFAVGMELDVSQLKRQVQTAIVVSHSSIVIPYLLGVALALFLYQSLAQPGASFISFALFMGISMSITAFPVLVRILKDRGIFKTLLGSTATACAAVDDVTAWTILAFVVAIARATSVGGAAFSFGLVILFIGLMFLVIKPAFPYWLGRHALERPEPDKVTLAIVVGLVIAAAFTTELIGIHALFGAFLAGTIMPVVCGFREKLIVRLENISSVLLLPVFFAFTGLRTQVGLLSTPRDWLICGLIIAVATVGKLGGSALAARVTGLDIRSSLQLGALMNTRGLMELIALNIGYDLGILSQQIFTMLVIMAIVTTVMTGPLVTLFTRRELRTVPSDGEEALPSTG